MDESLSNMGFIHNNQIIGFPAWADTVLFINTSIR